MTDTNVYKLCVIAVVIGLVFYNLVAMLIDFLRDINEKIEQTAEGKKKKDSTRRIVNLILAGIIIASLIGYGITKITLPEKVYIGTSQEQVDETH